VFPDEMGREPDLMLESVLTAGGITEAIEDRISAHADHHSSESSVSKTS